MRVYLGVFLVDGLARRVDVVHRTRHVLYKTHARRGVGTRQRACGEPSLPPSAARSSADFLRKAAAPPLAVCHITGLSNASRGGSRFRARFAWLKKSGGHSGECAAHVGLNQGVWHWRKSTTSYTAASGSSTPDGSIVKVSPAAPGCNTYSPCALRRNKSACARCFSMSR